MGLWLLKILQGPVTWHFALAPGWGEVAEHPGAAQIGFAFFLHLMPENLTQPSQVCTSIVATAGAAGANAYQ